MRVALLGNATSCGTRLTPPHAAAAVLILCVVDADTGSLLILCRDARILAALVFRGSAMPVGWGPMDLGSGAVDFDKVVESDASAWVIEFASKMCGSCQKFSPEFKSVAHAAGERLRFGVAYVEDTDGMALAERFGALDLGLPAVFLFYSDTRLGESSKPKPLIEGDGDVTRVDLWHRIKRAVKELQLSSKHKRGMIIKRHLGNRPERQAL